MNTTEKSSDQPFVFFKIIITFIVLSSILYTIVLFTILRHRQVFYNAHFFYKLSVILGICDFWGMINEILFDLFPRSSNYELIKLYNFYFWLFPYYASASLQGLLAANRCCAVIFYTKYNAIFNTSAFVKIYFLLCFLVPVAILGPFFSCNYNAICWYRESYFTIDKIFGCLIFAVIFVCYVAAYISKKHINALVAHESENTERRFLYQAAINSTQLLATYPLYYGGVYFGCNGENWFVVSRAFLRALNYTINPYVYLCFNNQLRSYVCNTIMRQRGSEAVGGSQIAPQ